MRYFRQAFPYPVFLVVPMRIQMREHLLQQRQAVLLWPFFDLYISFIVPKKFILII